MVYTTRKIYFPLNGVIKRLNEEMYLACLLVGAKLKMECEAKNNHSH